MKKGMRKELYKLFAVLMSVSLFFGPELSVLAMEDQGTAQTEVSTGDESITGGDEETLAVDDTLADENDGYDVTVGVMTGDGLTAARSEEDLLENEVISGLTEYRNENNDEPSAPELFYVGGSSEGGSEDLINSGEGKTPFDGNRNHFKLSLSENTISYNGMEQTPKFTIDFTNDSGVTRTLAEGTDYTVEYKDNIDPGYGEAVFTCPGTDDLEAGSFSGYFRISYYADRNDFLLTPSSNRINITNNDRNGQGLYFIATEKGQDVTDVIGEDIEAGVTSAIKYYYDSQGRKKSFVIGKEYDVYAGSWLFLSTSEELRFEYEVVFIGTCLIPESSDVFPKDYEADGYGKIKFSAVTQKNQDVKISWSPSAKVDPDYANYKKFKLFAIDENENFTVQIWPLTKAGQPDVAKGSKSAVIKAADYKMVEDGIVCLAVYDKDGNDLKKRFLTAVTPYVYSVRSGKESDEQEFEYSALYDSDELAFSLQAGDKNKEESFTLKSQVPSVGAEKYDLVVSKKQTTPVFRSLFYAGDSKAKLTVGNKYFFRMRSEYTYMGKKVPSAPSKALSVKVGPSKCSVIDISGADPASEAKAAKEGKYDLDSVDHVHYDSYSTCYKLGYVTFLSNDPINSTVSRVELLKCDNEHGTYKVAKKYKVSEVKSVDFFGIQCYYLSYNNFPPEETWYYSVRLVSAAGGAAGGFDDGFENRTIFEKPYEVGAVDTGEAGIFFAWLHDDCAKKYYIYRDKSVAGLSANLANGTVYKKVSGTSPKKITVEGEVYKYHQFEDTNCAAGDEYCYAVRPVYNEKVAKTQKYIYDENDPQFKDPDNFYYCVFDTGMIKATMGLTQIKTVKAAPYSVKELTVTWSALPVKNKKLNKISGYEIQSKPMAAGEESWKTIQKVGPETKEYKKRTYNAVVDTGVYTVFRIRGILNDGKDVSAWDYPYDPNPDKAEPKTHNPAGNIALPLPVSSFTVGKQSGSYFSLGGNANFKIDKKDMYWVSQGTKLCYRLTYMDSYSSERILAEDDLSPYSSSYSVTDDRYLERGINRKYKVYIYTVNSLGEEVDGSSKTADFKKPSNIDLGGSKEVEEGSTITINVGMNGTVKDLDSVSSSNTDILRIKEVNGNSIKVEGVRKGTAHITVRAYQHNWTDGCYGGDRLSRSVEIKVKEKPKQPQQ